MKIAFTLANVPVLHTPVRITTADGSVYQGTLRHAGITHDGTEIINIHQGAGWWTVPVAEISRITVTGPVKPAHVQYRAFPGCTPRRAFAE